MQSIKVNATRREDSFAADGMKGQQPALGQDFAAIFASFAGISQDNSSSLSALLSSLNPQELIRTAPKPRSRTESEQKVQNSRADTPDRLSADSQPRQEDPLSSDSEVHKEQHEERGAERPVFRTHSEQLTEPEKLQLKPEDLTGPVSFEAEGDNVLQEFSDSPDLLSSMDDSAQKRQQQNLRLFTTLQPQSQEVNKQVAAAQMQQVSDEKVQVDLKALQEGLKASPESAQTPEDGELQQLFSKSNVLSVEVKSRELDEVVRQGKENVQDLSTIAESIKLGSRLKSDGQPLFSSEEGGSGTQSQTPWFMLSAQKAQAQAQSGVNAANPDLQAQMGAALSTLQKQAGQAMASAETESSSLSISGTEGAKAAVQGKASGQAGVQAQEGLSFGQQVTAELNSAVRGEKTTAAKTQLAENLRRNAEELARQVMTMAARNLQSVELNLNPGELGKLKISIDVTGADEVTRITVAASNPATRVLVGDTLPRLRELMAEQGMEVQTELAEDGNFAEEQQDAHESAEQNSAKNGEERGASESGYLTSQVAAGEQEKIEDLAQSSQNEHTLNFFA